MPVLVVPSSEYSLEVPVMIETNVMIFTITFRKEHKVYQENGVRHSFPLNKVRLELSSLLIELG